MSEGKEPEERGALLAFVECNWRELTLRDARSLCVEIVHPLPEAAASIKASLTFR
jgi:hypothetical protein